MDKLKKKMQKNKYARSAISLMIVFDFIRLMHYLIEKFSFKTFCSKFISLSIFEHPFLKINVALGFHRFNF
jgi:hypothetical protein